LIKRSLFVTSMALAIAWVECRRAGAAPPDAGFEKTISARSRDGPDDGDEQDLSAEGDGARCADDVVFDPSVEPCRSCAPESTSRRGERLRLVYQYGSSAPSDGAAANGQGQAAGSKGNGGKTSGPTTFPQALRGYLQCLHARHRVLGPGRPAAGNGTGQNGNLKPSDMGGQEEISMNQDGDEVVPGDDFGEDDPNDDETGVRGRNVSRQNSIDQEDLGAERGGRSITIEGQPGTPGQRVDGRTGQADLGAERGGRAITIEGQPGTLTDTGLRSTWFTAHAQGTVVDGVHDHFFAPYSGPNSLQRIEPHAVSETATMFFAARLWKGGDFVFNPEIAGGQGFSGSSGIAGFPNGEITRVGVVEPTPYLARLYFRQTWGLGGGQEVVEDGINTVAGVRDRYRFTVAVGRFAMTDLIDDNKFSHDPRTQFMAWSIMYNGAWDYPANVRGYTDGIALDYDHETWELHYVIGAVSTVANGAALDPRFLQANGQALEWVKHYTIGQRRGNLRLMTYLNLAHMGKYAKALEDMPVDPDVTATRSNRAKYGFGVSWDQELTSNLGVFGRWGWNDGHTETWMFTPIDRLVEFGIWARGNRWCRPNDQFGMAVCFNGLAKIHREYLAAGGLDFNIGDGKLNYARETILETVYNLGVTKNILFSLDFQEVWNPAYNRDRGPVSIFLGRFHFEF
jgi:high affinity Mn2+ porin